MLFYSTIFVFILFQVRHNGYRHELLWAKTISITFYILIHFIYNNGYRHELFWAKTISITFYILIYFIYVFLHYCNFAATKKHLKVHNCNQVLGRLSLFFV